jgi:hypothetical protein
MPGSMVELRRERADGWAGLCRFLGRPMREVPFPHLDKSG